jgi:hypothetical protein
MRKSLILAAACLVAALTQAAPVPSGQWQLRATVRPYFDLGLTAGSMYNPRTFDGAIYANEIGDAAHRCFARYSSGSSTMLAGVIPAINEHRMVAPFRGANSSTYMMASGGANTDGTTFAATFTRYNFDGTSPVTADTIDGQVVESFDWVDDDTIISTCYISGERKKLYLTDVAAEPFALTKNTTWNAAGFISSAATTRIRNVRVGETYPNYAYYGDNAVSVNPKVYAVNLTTGAETEVGHWNGTLKAGTAGGAATGSWGLWTVVERGGYLYLQSSDDGIQVYSMTDATTMGSLYTAYSKAELDAATGGTPAYYGFDVAPNGVRLLLGGYTGNVYELQRQGAPYLPTQLQLSMTIDLAADLGIVANSTFNPRSFDGYVYANAVNQGSMGFGRYLSGSPIPSVLVTNVSQVEHRMVAPFRGALRSTYILGSSQAFSPVTTTFSRYDFDGRNRVDANTPDLQTAEGFDWVDDNTIIYTVYNPSANRKLLYLVDVVAEPFSLSANTAWNASANITTSVSTRIRNVRVGDVYSGYAYYGDGNQNSNPNFYAVNLATGAETLLGNAGTLTGTGSFGVWTVLERGGYLYVQTTDNGIQVYNLTGPTTLGALHATYDKATLDAVTGYTGAQYYGLDATLDGRKLSLGAAQGLVFELGPPSLSIAASGTDVVLSWPASVTAVVVQSSSSLSPASFSDISPSVVVNGKLNTATVTPSAGPEFFRLRKSP